MLFGTVAQTIDWNGEEELFLPVTDTNRKRFSDALVRYLGQPGASRTNLLKDTASTFNKILWSITSHVIAQSAAKGSWPEVLCATEEGLKPETLYGPTKRMETVGAVGECLLHEPALDREMAAKLWTISEQKTALSWSL